MTVFFSSALLPGRPPTDSLGRGYATFFSMRRSPAQTPPSGVPLSPLAFVFFLHSYNAGRTGQSPFFAPAAGSPAFVRFSFFQDAQALYSSGHVHCCAGSSPCRSILVELSKSRTAPPPPPSYFSTRENISHQSTGTVLPLSDASHFYNGYPPPSLTNFFSPLISLDHPSFLLHK